MFARIGLTACPRIEAIIEPSEKHRSEAIHIFIRLAETSGAYYLESPTSKLKKELEGDYRLPGSNLPLPEIPEKVVKAAKESIAAGGYNQGFTGDYFDAQAFRLFFEFKPWREGGKEEYHQVLDKAEAKIKRMRERYSDPLPLILALGLPMSSEGKGD